jgi:hypothetical protein
MYRSSARKFVQSILGLIDEGRDIPFTGVAELREYTLSELLSALRVDKDHLIQEGMPDKDWQEIVDYISNFTTAHGPGGLQFYDNKMTHSFLCWLACVGVELLADM